MQSVSGGSRDWPRTVASAILRLLHRGEAAEGNPPLPEGGFLLVANHQSYLDWAVIQLSLTRKVRFVALAAFFRFWWSGWFLRMFGTIPIEGGSALASLKSIIQRLQAGDCVCLFAEGEISRTGRLLRLREGYRIAARKADAPVVPLWLESLWGSRLSYARGGLLRGGTVRPPKPVRIHWGSALSPEEATPERVRSLLLNLSADAFAARPDVRQAHAGRLALERLSKSPQRVSIIVRSAKGLRRVSGGSLLLHAARLLRVLNPLPKEARIACWASSGFPRSVCELSAALADRPLLSIDETTPLETGAQLLARAGTTHLLTHSKGLEDRIRTLPNLECVLLDSLPRPALPIHLLEWLAFHTPGLPARILAKHVRLDPVPRERSTPRSASSANPGESQPAASGTSETESSSPWCLPARQALQLAISGTTGGTWFFLPGAAPGWMSTWLPMLTDTRRLHRLPGSDTGWLARTLAAEGATHLVARADQIQSFLERGEPLGGCGLQKILILGRAEPIGELASQAEQAWQVPLLFGWCDPATGHLLTLDTLDSPPPNAQPGRRLGSLGKPMPGVCIESPKTAGGGLRLRAPFLGIEAAVDTGVSASIDPDGFVIPDLPESG